MQTGPVRPGTSLPSLPEWLASDELAAEVPEHWPARVPGDPDRVQQLVTRLGRTASGLDQQHQRLSAIKTETFWKGDAAAVFDRHKNELNPLLAKVDTRYQGTVAALKQFQPELAQAQQWAKQAARDGTEALAEIRTLQAAAISAPPPGAAPPTAPIERPGEGLAAGGSPVDGAPARPGLTSPPVFTGTPTAPYPVEGPPMRGAPVHPLQPVNPWQPVNPGLPVNPGQPQSPALQAAYERFAGAMGLMHRAMSSYDDASKRCANAINKASHDDLVDSSAYRSDFAKLKHELVASLGAASPQLRAQAATLTSVAGLLAWVPMAAAMAGRSDPALAKTLASDVAGWKNDRTGGTTVVDDFLKVMGSSTQRVGGLATPMMRADSAGAPVPRLAAGAITDGPAFAGVSGPDAARSLETQLPSVPGLPVAGSSAPSAVVTHVVSLAPVGG